MFGWRLFRKMLVVLCSCFTSFSTCNSLLLLRLGWESSPDSALHLRSHRNSPHLNQFFQVTGLTPLHNLLNLATAKPFLAFLHGQGQHQVNRIKCWFVQ